MTALPRPVSPGDRQQLIELLCELGQRLDAKDFDGYARCYTPDGTLSLPWGQAGAPELAAFARRDLGHFAHTRHRTTNHVVEPSGEGVTLEADLLAVHCHGGDGRERWIVEGRYHCTCARTPDGWRFARVALEVVRQRRPVVRYRGLVTDSARWDDIALRDGDIVISTPPKCGTTWTQMICALLIFQSSDFPRPLGAMSVWPDSLLHRHEDMVAELAAQRHRRFIKTHIPLDGLPYDERVTYLHVARDPRDVLISWDNHLANMNWPAVMALRAASAGAEEAGVSPPEPPELPESARDRFWLRAGDSEFMVGDGMGLPAVLHHMSTFWQVRDQPNVILLHYQEMQDDLEGTMRRLATRLGIEVPEDRWPELVRAASFGEMRSRADELAPESRVWLDRERFFHRGTSGQWRDLLDPDDLRRYRDRVQELADPELAEWVHRGRILP